MRVLGPKNYLLIKKLNFGTYISRKFDIAVEAFKNLRPQTFSYLHLIPGFADLECLWSEGASGVRS